MKPLSVQEQMDVNGGLVITTGAIIAGVCFLVGVGIGVAWALSD